MTKDADQHLAELFAAAAKAGIGRYKGGSLLTVGYDGVAATSKRPSAPSSGACSKNTSGCAGITTPLNRPGFRGGRFV